MSRPRRLPALLVLAFLLGAVATLALPPLHALPAVLAFAGLLHLLRRQQGAWPGFALGWAFGFGWFLAGLYWIAIAFFTDAERFGALAVPAVVLLAGGLALLPGLAGLILGLRRWRSVAAQALALGVLWSLAEIARGSLGLSFPWNPAALVWALSPATLQPVAWIGQWGLGAVTVAAAALPAVWLAPDDRPQWPAAAAGMAGLAVLLLAGTARLQLAPEVADTAVRLRLVQANIAQTLKWDPALREQWFARHLTMSRDSRADLVIWPETAVPYQLAADENARIAVAEVAPAAGYVLTGGNRYELDREPPVAHNSLFAIAPDATVAALYDKVELVPFGEFLPFRGLLGRLGLGKLTEGTLDFVPGPGAATLELAGFPPFRPLICYEAIFPLPAPAAAARPQWLLNITNDAWFGRSSGPYQHLAMARLRAVEEGLPLVRAANSGISAIVDPLGRVRQSLALGATGVIDAALPGALAAPPPFARLGGLATALLLAALAGLSLWVELAHGRPGPAGPAR
ncbi:MAG: apolipoprotein N-acyltransferase [Geminicoccaceae bacterium]